MENRPPEPLVPSVDFLPAEFREHGRARRAAGWRVSAIGIVVTVLLGVAVFQWSMEHSARAELARVEQEHAAVLRKEQRLAELHKQLAALRQSADLVTLLRCPWPATQLLHATLAPLPLGVALTEWSLKSEVTDKLAAAAYRAPVPPKPGEETRPGEWLDLERLLSELKASRWAVELSGVASETASLHRYLADVARVRFYEKVALGSVQKSGSLQESEMKFTAHLSVQPGYGLPGGPTAVGAVPTAPLMPSAAAAGGPRR